MNYNIKFDFCNTLYYHKDFYYKYQKEDRRRIDHNLHRKSTLKNKHKVNSLVNTEHIRNDHFTLEQLLNYQFEECEVAMRNNGGQSIYLNEKHHQKNTDAENCNGISMYY